MSWYTIFDILYCNSYYSNFLRAQTVFDVWSSYGIHVGCAPLVDYHWSLQAIFSFKNKTKQFSYKWHLVMNSIRRAITFYTFITFLEFNYNRRILIFLSLLIKSLKSNFISSEWTEWSNPMNCPLYILFSAGLPHEQESLILKLCRSRVGLCIYELSHFKRHSSLTPSLTHSLFKFLSSRELHILFNND